VAGSAHCENVLAARGEIDQSTYQMLAADLPGDVANLNQQRHALGVAQGSPVRRRRKTLSPVGIKFIDGREGPAEPGDIGASAHQMPATGRSRNRC
jgi:hypothetical protein